MLMPVLIGVLILLLIEVVMCVSGVAGGASLFWTRFARLTLLPVKCTRFRE